METVLDHLSNAIDELEAAHNKAPLGTRMMIQEILNEAERLEERVSAIIDNGSP